MKPIVTVLTAVKDSRGLLEGCLDCLTAQTLFKRSEVIVIDHSSTADDRRTVQVRQRKYPNIRYLVAKKKGLYHAWNLGIRASRGRYLTNLNSDDRLRKDALEIMAGALDRRPEIALVYGDSFITKKPREVFEKNSSRGRTTRWPEYSHRRLLMQYLCGPHPMWRKSLHQKLGLFDESFVIAGDYDFALRVAEEYPLLRIPETLGLFLMNPSGLSLSHQSLLREENHRIKRLVFDSK